jgi:hypothetical protein
MLDKVPWIALGVVLGVFGLYSAVVIDEWLAKRRLLRYPKVRRWDG